MATKRERCDCPKCKIEYDKDERDCRPYCWQYDVWLDWDGRAKEFIDPEHAYRSKICFIHGRPKQTGLNDGVELVEKKG